MEKRAKKFYDYMPEEYTPLRKGIDYQREMYKNAMLDKNYDAAATSLNNIKAEIRRQAIAKGNRKKIIRIHKIIMWYKCLPLKYTQKTEDGYETMYPPDIELRITLNLNVAYELLIEQLSVLGLI